MGNLGVEVVLFAARAQLDFLGLVRVRGLFVFFCLLGLVVLVFAVVANLANRRPCLGGNFHEVIRLAPFLNARALGEVDGLVKTIFDAKTGELLGAHLIGAEVTELIQGFVIAMNLETTEVELMQSVFPHPTLSEMMHESTLEAYARAIHV